MLEQVTHSLSEDQMAYGRAIDSLISFLEGFASARVNTVQLGEIAETLDRFSAQLSFMQVDECEQPFGRQHELATRGQTLVPAINFTEQTDVRVAGTLRMGRYFLGGNGAVHGGVLPLLFDDILGRLANAGRSRCRTGRLAVNFRSITPIYKMLTFSGWFEKEEGRKRFLRAEIYDGDVLCADAEALFIALREGQR